MRFNRYSRGAIVAYPIDPDGTIGLRRPDGLGLLRTYDGIPRSAVQRSDIRDVIAVLSCIADDLDAAACRGCGVEVMP